MLNENKLEKADSLYNCINDCEKNFQDTLNDTKDVKIIYNNYYCDFKSENYLKESKNLMNLIHFVQSI